MERMTEKTQHGMPSCSASQLQAAMLAGSWTRRGASLPPYRLTNTSWRSMGLTRIQPAQDYGRCDNTSVQNRTLHDWTPSHCQLHSLSRETLCSSLGLYDAHKLILFVGDSTVAQVFLSFALLVNASFGRNDAISGNSLLRMTASVCEGRVRLSYVRNDLLLWSVDGATMLQSLRCAWSPGYANRFVEQALVADHIVFGVGQHFARAVDKTEPQERHQIYDFYVRSLNLTLSQASRSARSVVLLGPSQPVPRCASHSEPLRNLIQALNVEAEGTSTSHSYAASWRHNSRVGMLGQWVASTLGITFLTLAGLSIQRPDGAMGGRGELDAEDCLHYCMPGVPDTFAQLVFSALAIGRSWNWPAHKRSVAEAVTGGKTSVAVANWSSASRYGHLSQVGDVEWHTVRGVTKAIDCRSCHALLDPKQLLEAQPWATTKVMPWLSFKPIPGLSFKEPLPMLCWHRLQNASKNASQAGKRGHHKTRGG